MFEKSSFQSYTFQNKQTTQEDLRGTKIIVFCVSLLRKQTFLVQLKRINQDLLNCNSRKILLLVECNHYKFPQAGKTQTNFTQIIVRFLTKCCIQKIKHWGFTRIIWFALCKEESQQKTWLGTCSYRIVS